jgi:large subunit ribosomal protein L4
MQLDVVDRTGTKIRSIEADDQVFGLKPNKAVVHQTMVAQRANLRQGTHSTKTRGEVAGSTRKLFRQKGTGRARQGGIRAPHRRGGGITFGPKPRSYKQDLPKRMRRLAIRSVISAKAAGGDLRVIDALTLDKPRTKELTAVLEALGFERKTLVVTASPDSAIKLSAKNSPNVKWMPASYLNVLDMLSYRGLLMTEDAVRVAEALWGGERANKRLAPLPEVAIG